MPAPSLHTRLTLIAARLLAPHLDNQATAASYVLRALISYGPDESWHLATHPLRAIGQGSLLPAHVDDEECWSYTSPPSILARRRSLKFIFFVSSGMADCAFALPFASRFKTYFDDLPPTRWSTILHCYNHHAILFAMRHSAGSPGRQLTLMIEALGSRRGNVTGVLVHRILLSWAIELATTKKYFRTPQPLLGLGTLDYATILRREIEYGEATVTQEGWRADALGTAMRMIMSHPGVWSVAEGDDHYDTNVNVWNSGKMREIGPHQEPSCMSRPDPCPEAVIDYLMNAGVNLSPAIASLGSHHAPILAYLASRYPERLRRVSPEAHHVLFQQLYACRETPWLVDFLIEAGKGILRVDATTRPGGYHEDGR